MSDLRSLLDRAAGNPPDLPDMGRIRARGDALRARRRVRWTVAVVAASLLVAAGAVSVRQLGRNQLLVPAHPAPTTQTRATVTNHCPAVSIPARGGIVYSGLRPDRSTAVMVMPAGGGPGRCVVDTPGSDSGPAWAPDGEWIAFVGGDGGQDDVFLVRADGSGLTKLTKTSGRESGPVWSPDGQRLGYTVRDPLTSRSSIHVVGREGGSDRVVLLGSEVGMVALEDWSPDGNTLLFTRDDTAEGGHIALWAMSPSGSEQRLLRAESGDFGSGARYSPDGTQIALQADLDGGCIYRGDPLAQHLTKVTTGCSQAGSLSWSPDGKRLVVAGGGHGPAAALVVAADGSSRETLRPDQTVSDVDWSSFVE